MAISRAQLLKELAKLGTVPKLAAKHNVSVRAMHMRVSRAQARVAEATK